MTKNDTRGNSSSCTKSMSKACDLEMDQEMNHSINLVDAAYLYITESKYPEECTETSKRSIRKKAKKFVVREGVMYFLKKKKHKVCTEAI